MRYEAWPYPDVPKHRHGISFRKVSALTDALEEFSADSELERKIILRP
jgi:hypothetical protein